MNAKSNCQKLCIPSLRIISFGKHLTNIAVDAMGRVFIATLYHIVEYDNHCVKPRQRLRTKAIACRATFIPFLPYLMIINSRRIMTFP